MKFENIKLDYLYQQFNNFKESEILKINSVLQVARVGSVVCFSSYGNCSFDETDNKHEFATINELNSFERKNTNCIVYKVVNEEYSKIYTHIFVYHNVTASDASFGVICYNSNTGKATQKIQITYDAGELVMAFNKIMLYMQNPNPFANCYTSDLNTKNNKRHRALE